MAQAAGGTWRSSHEPRVYTGVGLANLRGGPGTSFEIVGQMQPGESLPIVGSNVDRTWWQVQAANGPLWVSSSVALAARVAERRRLLKMRRVGGRASSLTAECVKCCLK